MVQQDGGSHANHEANEFQSALYMEVEVLLFSCGPYFCNELRQAYVTASADSSDFRRDAPMSFVLN